MSSVEQLQQIRHNISKWQKQSPSASGQVTLIAVSKTQPVEAILPLIEAGQWVYGENRVQEAAEKWPSIRKKYPHIELHLIGSLQSNKAKMALNLFDAIHTIDRPSLVDTIVTELQKSENMRCRQFFIQVNTGEEPQKGGVVPQEFPELLNYIKLATSHLPLATFSITGLMCVPPANELPAPHFALLHKMAKEHNLPYLSIGMSGDYETAIRLGATHIRIGTLLFGDRRTDTALPDNLAHQ